MSRRAEILVHLEGPLLVGGYASSTSDLDAVTAIDAAGVPIIPASTLKGAIREACTRLARFEGDDKACTIDQPCKGDCLVCQLFGRAGSDADDVLAAAKIDAGRLGGIFLGDARPDTRANPVEGEVLRRSLRTRPGVGIDRRTRAAVPQVLYAREVLDAPGHTLVAPLRAHDVSDEAWDLFTRALRLVTGIGNSRSRGLGAVQLSLCDTPHETAARHVFPRQAPAHGGAVIEIEALEPLLLGGLPSTSSLRDTIAFLAGSALRGALGTAAARHDTGERFQETFVRPESCLLFSDAYPTPAAGAPLPVPAPRSSLACKHKERRDHAGKSSTPIDGLLALAFAARLQHAQGGSVPGHRCDICKAALSAARGYYPPAAPLLRIVTRLGRDIATGSAMPELLYTTTPFEAGTRFAGTTGRLTPRALEALRALEGEEIRIGRGRRRGQGLVKITVRDAPQGFSPAALRRRLGDYGKSLGDTLAQLGKAIDPSRAPPGGAVAVLSRTDLALPLESAPEAIRKAIYGDAAPRAQVIAVAQGAGERSGWSDGRAGDASGQRPQRPVVAAGSAWLFVHEKGVALNEERLFRALEAEGIGDHRELGLGRLAIAHELFHR